MEDTTKNRPNIEEAPMTDEARSPYPEGTYPPGLEPDYPEGFWLEEARKKERRYTMLLRFELLALLAAIIVIIVLILI